jgi:hypothetical protein
MKHATKILAGAATVAAALVAFGCSADGYVTSWENDQPGPIEWKSSGSSNPSGPAN